MTYVPKLLISSELRAPENNKNLDQRWKVDALLAFYSGKAYAISDVITIIKLPVISLYVAGAT